MFQLFQLIFERMTFVVRDLARESGKKIIVQLTGGETEIDKFLVERMMDPLMHLVRNAVSHGFETVEQREAQGKRSEGLLTLSAMAKAAWRPACFCPKLFQFGGPAEL